jgi:hypothetical protein
MTLVKPHQSTCGLLTDKFDKNVGELLAGPLDRLLASGGDARLKVDPITALNIYGCRASPRPEAIAFASSTASTISDYGYAAAEAARAQLLMSRNGHELIEILRVQTEQQRTELADLFGLRETGSEIIFAPSGTDAQVYAMCVVRTILHAPVLSVLVASDETGSGADQAVEGKHFSAVTSCGLTVEKGAPIRGLEGASKVSIPLRSESGRLHSAAELDAEVFRTVRQSVESGKSVFLCVMDHSKLGSQCPSDSCVCEILGNWPDSVQVAVDACQLRVSGDRIRAYLDDGHIVIVTGSKFFGGPPFSGALLVPRAVSERMAKVDQVPAGLRDYSNGVDWPPSWKGVRAQLPNRANIGQFLRWAVSLAEMRNYFAVPTLVRRLALRQFAQIVVGLIESYPNLKLLPSINGSSHDNSDDEMAVRTIFPFLVYRDGAPMSLSETKIVYQALNRDLSEIFVESEEKMLSRKLCHIGQPVGVRVEGGILAGALRISCDARLIAQSWFERCERAGHKRLHSCCLQIDTILQKLNLIRTHFDTLVYRRTYTDDVAGGQLAVFQGARDEQSEKTTQRCKQQLYP